ncbi:alpha/beta hydrolase [Sphingomonas canadensis]|uniref:Alpha/beta hydrolase n=1 Tax=Sphingomonas canadensis TaxID=1219257 RepID=A0ABW3H2E5_9SPHN
MALIALPGSALAQIALPPAVGISTEARASLAADAARPPAGPSLPARRARIDSIQQEIGGRMLARYGVTMRETVIAGVPVRIFTPAGWSPKGPLLMNLHGGGFIVDAGSRTENIPVAALTGYRVVAVRYRLAPEYPFPAALDDAEAVYRALREEADGQPVAVFGTSAGAILTGELIARLKALGAPLPAAVGFFSGTADLEQSDDAMQLFGGVGASDLARIYAGTRALRDPALSPLRGDVSGWPPTLCLSSGRDFLLGSTATLCRVLDAAGVPATLHIFDGLPHAFWAYVEAPESDAAFATMARFFLRNMGGMK